MNETLPGPIADLIHNYGDFGIFAAMFLESSVVPMPSEVVIAGALVVGFSLLSIIVFGTLGATFGAMFGYAIGRFAGLPFILKFGRFILITPERLAKAEAFAQKYGVWGVLGGRLIPFIPFKIFSIASGITRIGFIPFMICTIIGTIPRFYMLAVFGKFLVDYTAFLGLS